MSAETRAVRDAMIDALKAKSSNVWEFRPDGQDTVTVCYRDDWAVAVHARSTKAQIRIPAGLVDYEFQYEHDGPQFLQDQRLRMVQVSSRSALGLVWSEHGYWYTTLSPEEYEASKRNVLNLMLLAQARLLIKHGI